MNIHPHPFISVIIPTFNRAKQLDLCLKNLFNQNLAKEAYEVWVVDDGSTDSTQEILKKWSLQWEQLHFFHQKNAGQGVARNQALHHAKGQIILFIGDDIYGTPSFLELHAKFHQENPQENQAALGLTEWYPAAEITPYMKWLTHGGPQFAYHKLKAHQKSSFWFFYTSNISLKKSLLEKAPFDISFKGYGWEDIELGYRLQKEHQLELIYLPEALAFHDHFLPESGLAQKMQAIAKNGRVFQEKYPELKVLPKGIKKRALQILTLLPLRKSIQFFSKLLPILKPLAWTLESKYELLQGMKKL